MRPLGWLAAAALLARGAAAQTAGDTVRLTLDQAVARALAQGEEMRIARAQVQDARGQMREALSDAFPHLTGSVVYTRQFASIYQSLGSSQDTTTTGFASLFKNTPFGAPNSWNASLTASQILWEGGKVGAGFRGARAYRRAAQETEAQTAADITYQVKSAYLNAATAGRLWAVAASNLEQAEDQLRQTSLFHQAGTRSDYDLLRARVDAANQEPQVVAAQSAYELSLLELKRLVNLPAEAVIVLDTALDAADGTVPVVADTVLADPDRPALQAAEANVEVLQAAFTVARGDRWPTLSVSSTLSEQAFPQEVWPSNSRFLRSWNAEVRLSIPIFLGFRTDGSVARAAAELEQAKAQRDQVREQVALDLAQARADVRRTFSLLAARHETVTEADRALHLAGVRYANGMATQLEVSDARVLRQTAQVNEVEATRDYLLALAALERALGRPLPLVRRPLGVATAPDQGTTP